MAAKFKFATGHAVDRDQDGASIPRRRSHRKTMFAGRLALGALMVGIVYNATLNQAHHNPAAVSADASDTTVAQAAPEHPPVVAERKVEAPPEIASSGPADVDMTPVGAIPAKHSAPVKAARKPPIAKASKPKIDAIAALLNGMKSTPSR